MPSSGLSHARIASTFFAHKPQKKDAQANIGQILPIKRFIPPDSVLDEPALIRRLGGRCSQLRPGLSSALGDL